MIDLVQMFEDAATVYGYRFAYGAKDILNYEAGQADLISGEYIVMVFPFVETANLANNIMNGFKVNTQVWLGRKFDTTSVAGTKSNIDETEKQKYDRRLKTMRTAMEAYIKYVFCLNDPALVSVKIFRELNRFTTNIDFITADITFEYDNVSAYVAPAPTATMDGSTVICEGQDTDISVILTGSAPWNFTYTDGVTPVAVVGALVSPYVITVSPIVNTTYEVTAVSDVNGPGTDFGDSAIIAVYANTYTVDAGPDQAVCESETIQLTGAIGGGATGATWSSDGDGTFDDDTDLDAIYTPGAGDIAAGTVTLTLTTNDPLGPCPAVSDSMLITINPQLFDDEPVVLPDGTAYLLCQNQLNLNLKNPVEFEWWYYFANTYNSGIGQGQRFFCVYNDPGNFFASGVNNNGTALIIGYKVNGGLLRSIQKNGFFDVIPNWFKIKITWDGTALVIYKNDILYSNEITLDNLNNMVQSATCDLYVLNPSPAYAGENIQPNNKLFGFKYKTNGSLIVHYPICEESGNTVYNVVSNAYHLTGQSGFNALNWSRDNDQEKYLRDNGYRLSGGVYIPALLSGASAADGNPLTVFPPCTEFN